VAPFRDTHGVCGCGRNDGCQSSTRTVYR
jgi:hypothetical protein